MLFIGELEVTGRVSSIYYSLGEEVNKGNLVLELNTDVINDKILIQEIYYFILRDHTIQIMDKE